PAEGWAMAPKDAKEFTVLMNRGLTRRPSLILKNEDGIYDHVAIYKSKKEVEPMVELYVGKMVAEVVDEAFKGDVKIERANRNMKLLKLAEDGSSLSIYITGAMDMSADHVWHPKRLFKEVTENVGFPPPSPCMGNQDTVKIVDCMGDSWNVIADWQSDAILHLVESEDLDIVFSHYHGVDFEEHQFIKHLADRPFNRNPVEVAEGWMQEVYKRTDRYLGKFLHLLDEGWTIMIFSDHAQVAPAHSVPLLFDMNGLCTPLMEEMGYTAVIRDENGNEIAEVDWEKTRAVSVRECNIYINLKGREPYGCVDPADQYELEEEIMTALYGYRDPKTGHRIVSVALRNKDAVLLGYGGPECGDICFWMAEGYNTDHCDSLSTVYGEADTSVSPIFIAAGTGFKEGFYTDRIIRQIDVAPTVAVMAGVRMPAQCEGAPIYQIFAEEF
ncbi:MAG: alkaline phosphatase family protein, partial [Anaerotignum sp.]|nr:alkaline phosphatase family protein [Anaerotignum sp.]